MSPELTDYVPATNRFVTGINPTDNAYDVAGNLTRNKLGELLAYDANNKQVEFCPDTSTPCGSVAATAKTLYHYDGQGNRVKKVVDNNETSIYVYDAFGKLAAEYKDSGTPTPGTFYRTVDHLGSTRLVTDANGTEVENTDYLPFGEEIDVSQGDARHNVAAYGESGLLRHKFTGKERDSESGMDYFLARYYSGPMGRFLSVDPGNAGARPDEPQTWNAFAYVHNNPLAFIDPSGTMDFASNCSGGDTDCARQEGAGLRDAAQAATVGGTARAATVGVRSEQVRDSYNAEVKPLDEADTTGRTNAKARARAQTPPEVRAVIESQQPGLGPKPGSGGTANSTSDVANRTAKKLGRAGRRVAGVGLVLVAVDVVTAENKTRAIVSNAGATVGGIAGGAGGATLGALTGPAAPVLAPAGGIAGSIGGGEAGARAAEALFDFFSPPPVVPVPTPGN